MSWKWMRRRPAVTPATGERVVVVLERERSKDDELHRRMKGTLESQTIKDILEVMDREKESIEHRAESGERRNAEVTLARMEQCDRMKATIAAWTAGD